MTGSVYGSLATVNQLIVDACEHADDIEVPEWWFRCAADAIANGDLEDADYVLSRIEGRVTEQRALTPVRDARQLIIPLKEEWPQ